MAKNKTFHKKKTLVVFLGCMLMLTVLIGRLVNLMVVQSEYYAKKADDLHERERKIKAARGRILDANGVVLADNKTVCTISVIHSQIEDPEAVIRMLVKELELPESVEAPVASGDVIGRAVYKLGDRELGTVDILCSEDIAAAVYKDYFMESLQMYLP